MVCEHKSARHKNRYDYPLQDNDVDQSTNKGSAVSKYENICPDCGNVLTVCIGERNDCSYGEYLECSNCGYTN